MSHDTFFHHATLVYGPRKAGTTLLQKLLDGTSSMLMLPGELKLKRLALRKNAPAPEFVDYYARKGRSDFPLLNAPDFAFEGLDAEQTRELFDAPTFAQKLNVFQEQNLQTPGEVFRADVENFASCLKGSAKRSYARWSAKEVGGSPDVALQFFREALPDARAVFLVRNPNFIVRSILLDRRRKGVRLRLPQIWKECLEAQTIINYAFHHALKNETVVAYEHLTANTESEMQRIAKSLDLPFEEILTTPSTLGVPVVVRTSSKATQKVFQQEGDWRKDLYSDQIRSIRLSQTLITKLMKKQFVPYERLLQELSLQNQRLTHYEK
jgi:hypothetical protein